MPAKSPFEKHDYVQAEAARAWNWLRKLPEYRSDYEVFKRRTGIPQGGLLTVADETQPWAREFRTKWGFFPPQNPKSELPSVEFIVSLGRTFGMDPFDWPVHMRNLKLDALYDIRYDKKQGKWRKFKKKKLPELPRRLVLEIDPRAHVGSSVQHIEWLLTQVREAYKLASRKGAKPGISDLAIRYRVSVRRNLGWTDGQIKKELMSEFKEQPWESRTDNYRRLVERILATRPAVKNK